MIEHVLSRDAEMNDKIYNINYEVSCIMLIQGNAAIDSRSYDGTGNERMPMVKKRLNFMISFNLNQTL